MEKAKETVLVSVPLKISLGTGVHTGWWAQGREPSCPSGPVHPDPHPSQPCYLFGPPGLPIPYSPAPGELLPCQLAPNPLGKQAWALTPRARRLQEQSCCPGQAYLSAAARPSRPPTPHLTSATTPTSTSGRTNGSLVPLFLPAGVGRSTPGLGSSACPADGGR